MATNAHERLRRLLAVAALLTMVADCTPTSVSRRTSLGLPIAPLIAAANPGRFVPNDYSLNQVAFDVIGMPEAWWYFASFGGKYVSRTAALPSLFPTVLVADDGFVSNYDSSVNGAHFKGFGVHSDSAAKYGPNVHGQHGTEVLSVVGATKNNHQLIAGVAGLWMPSASSRKVTAKGYGLTESEKADVTADLQWSFGSRFVVAGITGSGTVAGVVAPNPAATAKAIEYWLKLDKELKVINLSQDYMNLDAIQGANVEKAFRAAEQAGVTIVIGAGNNGEVHNQRGRDGWLKPFSNVITVGALDPKGTGYLEWRAGGGSLSSARGQAVDVFAPGHLHMVNIKRGTPQENDGSSYSTPLVSGIVAMMYALNPKLSPSMVRRILMATATDVSIEGSTVFRVDAYRALFVAHNLAHPVYAPFRGS